MAAVSPYTVHFIQSRKAALWDGQGLPVPFTVSAGELVPDGQAEVRISFRTIEHAQVFARLIADIFRDGPGPK